MNLTNRAILFVLLSVGLVVVIGLFAQAWWTAAGVQGAATVQGIIP
jgi:hypothetical protein